MRSGGHSREPIRRSLRSGGLQIAARTHQKRASPRLAVAARTVSDVQVEDAVRQVVWQPDGQGLRKMQHREYNSDRPPRAEQDACGRQVHDRRAGRAVSEVIDCIRA